MINNKVIGSSLLPHIEALTQNILGMIIAFIILYLWGMSVSDSILLQAVFFVTSYIRSFLVRGVFRKLERKAFKRFETRKLERKAFKRFETKQVEINKVER